MSSPKACQDKSGPKTSQDKSGPETSQALRHFKTSLAQRHVKTSPALRQDKSGPETSPALRYAKTSPALRQVQPQEISGRKKKLASLKWLLFIGPSLLRLFAFWDTVCPHQCWAIMEQNYISASFCWPLSMMEQIVVHSFTGFSALASLHWHLF